jgi:hypothetical protein
MKRNSQFNQKNMFLEKIKTHCVIIIIISSDARKLTRPLEECKKYENVIFVKSRLLHCRANLIVDFQIPSLHIFKKEILML